MLFEQSKNAVGKASKGLRAVAAKSVFQDSCLSPTIHNRCGTSVVPQDGGTGRMTIGIHQPAAVPLCRQRYQPDPVTQLFYHPTHTQGPPTPSRIHSLLRTT